MAQYRSPPPLNFEEPKWDIWKAQFQTFRKVTKLHEEAEDVQIASLKYCMGYESEEIVETFNLTEAEAKKFDIVFSKFDSYFKPKINVIRMRRIFQRKMQLATENEETYLRGLYIAAQDCQFGDLKKERIRDQLIAGLRDEKLTEKLEHLYMSSNVFTLDTVVEYTRTYCDIREGRKKEEKEQEQIVAAINYNKTSRAFSSKNIPTDTDSKACGYCGTQHERNRCPAYKKKCAVCGRLNHFARVCRSNMRRQHLQEVTEEQGDVQEEESSNFFLGNINNFSDDWTVSININSHYNVKFKVDTGADVSVISYETYAALNPKPKLCSSSKILTTPAGKLEYIGVINCLLAYRNLSVEGEIFVMKHRSASNNLLSRKVAHYLKIVQFLGELNIKIDDSLFGFGCWNTEPVKFHVKSNFLPVAIYTARKIPVKLMQPVKLALSKMVEEGIIESIKTPTDWASGMVPVPKQNGTKVRITVDFRNLNKCLKREIFQIPTFDELSYQLRGAKIMSKLDAASGFFQIPLDEESRDYTTFLTPFGRFRFKRLPMGVNIAPEIYQRKMCELLEGIDGVLIYMDDVIVFGNSNDNHDKALHEVLNRIKNSGLKLNKEKCEFRRTRIEFLGHIISEHGIEISPSKTEAIRNLKIPENINDLRRILGMINFITKFIPNAQNDLGPLNELLRKDAHWCWGPFQQAAFDKLKEFLCHAPALAFFDPNKAIVVSADSSSYAIGGVILQRHEKILRPVAYCSRMLNTSERNYAQIERELLALVWTCDKFSMYLQYQEFTLQTDHKPLVPLINKKSLLDCPVRCQRLLMRLARYSPDAVYVPGKYLVVADSLSRDINEIISNDDSLHNDIECYAIQNINSHPISDTKLSEIIREQNRDNLIRVVKESVSCGQFNDEIIAFNHVYYKYINDLSIVNDLLVYCNRIVIPDTMRKEILKRVHDDGHLSLTKCRERIKETVWWPSISKDLTTYVDNCMFCQIHKRRNKCEPIIPSKLPDKPWDKIGLDLFELDSKRYLIAVDYFSRWFEVIEMKTISSECVIRALKRLFTTFGIPEIIRSDGGLQFDSLMFKNFANDYNFVHLISDPYFPQGNGCAERAVQAAKRLLRQSDPVAALMAYRSTPLETTGYSPAQLLMGRNIRTKLPVLPMKLMPRWPSFNNVIKTDYLCKSRSANSFNKRNGARVLPPLHTGQMTRIRLPGDKQWSSPEKIHEKTE